MIVTAKTIHKLIEDRDFRYGNSCFWVDGVNFVHQAIENHYEIVKLIYVEEKIDFKKEVVNSVPKSLHHRMDLQEYSTISSRKDIQGVGAVIRMKHQKNVVLPGLGVVLEHPSIPGNIGTIMRTCAAFGVKNLYVIGPSGDPYSFESVRASMGAIFHINLITMESHLNFDDSHTNIATSLHSSATLLTEYRVPDTEHQILIWFGSESRGLTPQSLQKCLVQLKIPITSIVDSLNLSEAVCIVLYELVARHQLALG